MFFEIWMIGILLVFFIIAMQYTHYRGAQWGQTQMMQFLQYNDLVMVDNRGVMWPHPEARKARLNSKPWQSPWTVSRPETASDDEEGR